MWQEFVKVADSVKLSTLIVLILVNVGLGMAVAIMSSKWQLSKVADWLKTRVVPYVLGYFTICLVATVDESWNTMVVATWGFIVAFFMSKIVQNLKDIGLPVPDALMKLIEKIP
jgi:phage-related holin